MIVKPARPGLLVRDPVSGQRIPDTGFEVSDTDTFWARRMADGDVIEVQPPPRAPAVNPEQDKE